MPEEFVVTVFVLVPPGRMSLNVRLSPAAGTPVLLRTDRKSVV